MQIWQAALLGLVQGLTEFLPVSSSGHLVVLQRLLGLNTGLFIPIVLHLGTLAAVCAVYRKQISALFKRPYKKLKLLVISTIPAGLSGLFLGGAVEETILNGRYAGIILGGFFTLTAAALFATDCCVKRRGKQGKGEGIGLKTALPMGFAQAVAVLPGISRSGSTICAGIAAGGDAEEVAGFSFLMSVPVILGSFAVDLAKGLADGQLRQAFTGGPEFAVAVAVGFATAALVGLFAINVMLKAIKKAKYGPFIIYLLCAAAVCTVLNFTGHLGNI